MLDWLVSVMLSMTATAPGEATHPLRLVVEQRGERVELRVVGESDAPVRASYALDASGGGGNRTRQRGEARLDPGRRVTLMTLTLGNAQSGWHASLTVEPVGAPPYQESRSAGPRSEAGL